MGGKAHDTAGPLSCHRCGAARDPSEVVTRIEKTTRLSEIETSPGGYIPGGWPVGVPGLGAPTHWVNVAPEYRSVRTEVHIVHMADGSRHEVVWEGDPRLSHTTLCRACAYQLSAAMAARSKATAHLAEAKRQEPAQPSSRSGFRAYLDHEWRGTIHLASFVCLIVALTASERRPAVSVVAVFVAVMLPLGLLLWLSAQERQKARLEEEQYAQGMTRFARELRALEQARDEAEHEYAAVSRATRG